MTTRYFCDHCDKDLAEAPENLHVEATVGLTTRWNGHFGTYCSALCVIRGLKAYLIKEGVKP